MKRSKPLRADPEKVREFQRRAREAQAADEDSFLNRSRAPLRSDREKTAAFVQRGREAGARVLAAAARAAAKERSVRVEGPLSPGDWREAAFRSSGGRCIITGSRARDVDDRRFHVHHAVPKDELRARGLFGHVWDPRNAVWLRADVHLAHEHAGGDRRVPRERLPASVWEFAQEMDGTDGTSWATMIVARAHPAAGDRGTIPRRG